MHRLLRVIAAFLMVTVTMTAAAGVRAGAASAAAVTPLRVWMNSAGSDRNGGTSAADGVVTLRRVQQILCPGTPCTGKGRPVEVRIVPGTYVSPADEAGSYWTYFDDQQPTTFLPAEYQAGWAWADVAAHGGRPTFDGRHRPGYGVNFRPARVSSTGRTNLRFTYLQFQGYAQGGISIEGQVLNTDVVRPGPRTADGNSFYGNMFTDIGNYSAPAAPFGYAGISLRNSRQNDIANNHFVDLRNAEGGQHEPWAIHGVYLSHDSDNNQIHHNNFSSISGDAIRVRNGSDSNGVERNTFTSTGNYGYLGDWYCVPAGSCTPKESPSYGNSLVANTFRGPYQGGLPAFRPDFCYDMFATTDGDCPADRMTVTG
ncbi:right-handed parallel beta-helix repeat-containing protein [Actinoplanes sp. NPDC049599]|uniref:right-handed parallel beta-helix repeat-containing protein n=1 Tax=Actinoplanes sp. NPDC049599 TaxID=3363903 RepID=UPI00378DA23F